MTVSPFSVEQPETEYWLDSDWVYHQCWSRLTVDEVDVSGPVPLYVRAPKE